MLLRDIVKQANVNSPMPLGTVILTGEFGKTEPRFLVVLKVSHEDFNKLRNTNKVVPIMDFVPTEDYPNLWFRLKIDDGSIMPNGHTAYFYCEYNFNILSEWHKKVLDDMIHTNKHTLLFTNPSDTENSYFHFLVGDDTINEIRIEIDACKNGISLYGSFDVQTFSRGQLEISKARNVSGEFMNIDLVKKQYERRLQVEPLPKGIEIKFV